jgi:hypothetical protein
MELLPIHDSSNWASASIVHASVSPAPPSLLTFETREDYAELDEKECQTYELPI